MTLFRSPCPLSALVVWCRSLRQGLDIGLSPVKVFKQLAKSGPVVLRPVAARVADRLAQGESLMDALRPEAWRFPNLFLELLAVGEQAGRLPTVLADLEKHYEELQAVRRRFLSSLIYPAFVYCSAILVITILILVLGAMTNPLTGRAMDPLGLGWVGVGGAIRFVVTMAILTGAAIGTVLVIAQNPQLRATLEGWALQVPGLRECVRAFALERFSLATALTHEAGLRAEAVMKSGFRATANAAYLRQMTPAIRAVKAGDEFVEALAGAGPMLFPEEFLHAVEVGETGGRLAEVLAQQATLYREQAVRRLGWLARLASGAVYLAVAALVIVCIFKLVNGLYLNPINDAFKIADDPEAWLRGS